MTRGPSSLYTTKLWRYGCWTVRTLPTWACNWLAPPLALGYWGMNRRRRSVVFENLLPIVGGNQIEASTITRHLFQEFARKIVDLWRFESGLSIEHLISNGDGWHHFSKIQNRGRGLLLLTPHLGNWELGAPLLAQRGVKLLVITLDEPETELTRLRQSSRARWGIETVVIGADPFAFVEVIRRLGEGATVAVLIDRPPAASAIRVELFGRPFLASLAAAEMARATGCALLPVYVPRTSQGYRAEMLPEIIYDRARLASREDRQKLTQEIVRAFEPIIKQYLSQWFHFVPIWPDA